MNELQEYYDEIDILLSRDGFSMKYSDKIEKYTYIMSILDKYHCKHNELYRNYIKSVEGIECSSASKFLPTAAFKDYSLKSNIAKHGGLPKELISSGTSGASHSKIYVDSNASRYQIKVLSKIVSKFMGTERKPMLVIDSPPDLLNSRSFSARVAASRGFGIFSSKITYALNADLSLNTNVVSSFLNENREKEYLIFGFTFLLYSTFFNGLVPLHRFDLSSATIIHGGGWKRLLNIGITNNELRKLFSNEYHVQNIRNYYGLVEQLGSIFFECSHGYLHASDFSDLTIFGRDNKIQPIMQNGLVGLTSLLPTSYPGHRIFTEDIGSIHHFDDCPCGILGTSFLIHGRHIKAQVRGCSDAAS